MNTAKAYTAHLSGLSMEKISVEVDISNGLHSFSIVGLGDRSIEEAKDRVSAAIKNTGYVSPKQKNQKVVISLAPADIRKEGPSFDLAIALAYLAGSGDIDFEYENTLFLGELSLEGHVRKVHGLLSILVQAESQGFTTVFIPKDNSEEASLAHGIIIYAVSTLSEVLQHISRTKHLDPVQAQKILVVPDDSTYHNDFSLIRGNETAKRALEIAAAGYHNVILYGPPGTGKTMLAQSLSSIMPPLTYEQAVEVTSIHSIAHSLNNGLITVPPFRSPHHTASSLAILGGGSHPKPGEITLAHRGILFMDEFPEFDRRVIEALRQPLEEKTITISRARESITFPAQCILIASMNPCRCGKGRGSGCTCSPKNIDAYRRRISPPILDRIDIWVEVSKIDYRKLSDASFETENSATVRKRVADARIIQRERFGAGHTQLNSEMNAKDIEDKSCIDDEARSVLTLSAEKMGLSGRAFHRVIKVARTIADLDHSKMIKRKHLLESLQYREKIY